MKTTAFLSSVSAVLALVCAQSTTVFAQSDIFHAEAFFTVSVANSAKRVFVDTLNDFKLKQRKNGACTNVDNEHRDTHADFPRRKKPGDVEYDRLFFRCLTPTGNTYAAFSEASDAAAEVEITMPDGKTKRMAVRVVVDTYESRLGTGACRFQQCRDGNIDMTNNPSTCASCR